MGDVGGYVGGVCVALLSTTTNAFGLFLQKSTHKKRENLTTRSGPIWKEPKWLLGLGCLFAGSMMSLAVFALLGQSRASAMAAITIAINAGFSTWFLKERFTVIDLATTALIGAGTCVSVIFGSSGGSSGNYNVQIIVDLLARDIVYITSGVLAAILFTFLAFLRWTSKRTDRGLYEEKLECFIRAFCAGIFSGTTGFLTKSTVVCITNMWGDGGSGDLRRWEFYAFVFCLPVSLVLQLKYLNSGLRRFDAMEIVPPYQSSIVTIGVAFGWIFFNEADALPLENKLFFAVGCGISILGISLLIFKRRALKAAALGADVPLFSPPVGPQAEYSMASHSLDSMVVIGDPTAALVSDITEEYQNAKSEYRRVSDASERSGIAMHSSFYGSTDTGRLRADSKNSHISTMP